MKPLSYYRQKVTELQGQCKAMTKDLEINTAKSESLVKRVRDLELAQAFLQDVAQKTQDQIRANIEGVVQMAIDAVFPGRYQFQVKFEIKRGKTEAALAFIKNGHEIDAMDSSGGGVVDVTAFALRIAMWTLARTRNTIVLDETFKHLSSELQPLAGQILKEIADKLGIQIIMVTHSKHLIDAADRVFKVSIDESGKSSVEIENKEIE